LLGELVLELKQGGVAPLTANAAEIGSRPSRRVAKSVLSRLGRLSPGAPDLAYAVASLATAQA